MSLSGAYVRVECDECSDSEEIELTALAGRGNWDERNVKRALEKSGWTATAGGAHYCECCQELREAEADPRSSPPQDDDNSSRS